jgi:hypothetical protein
MADARIRELERRARAGDEQAMAALHPERIRLEGYDPRVNPRPEDIVLPGPGRIPCARRVDSTNLLVGEEALYYLRVARWDAEHACWAFPRSVLLSSWRRWAKGGTVVRFGNGPILYDERGRFITWAS